MRMHAMKHTNKKNDGASRDLTTELGTLSQQTVHAKVQVRADVYVYRHVRKGIVRTSAN